MHPSMHMRDGITDYTQRPDSGQLHRNIPPRPCCSKPRTIEVTRPRSKQDLSAAAIECSGFNTAPICRCIADMRSFSIVEVWHGI